MSTEHSLHQDSAREHLVPIRNHDSGLTILTWLKRLVREIRVWVRLQHENVLPFIGFQIDDSLETAKLVCPWMEDGDLKTYLRARPYNRRERLTFVRPISFSLSPDYPQYPPPASSKTLWKG